MTDLDRETHVLGAVVSLVDTLLDDFDVVELLTELTERCVALLDISSTGLLLADPRGHLQLMAATSEQTHDLELFQLQSDQGPCLDSYTSGQPVSVADLSARGARWPRFTAAAVNAGFASVHAVPVRAAGNVLGALGLFGTEVGDLGAADQLLAQTLAHVACVAILQDHPLTPDSLHLRLRAALASRVVVEQAKGFLCERLGVSAEDAFTLLRRYARASDGHLAVVSKRLLTEPATRTTILTGMHQLASGAP